MAYDPNDAEDKKIVGKLIADALAEQATEHETATAGLTKKNKELLDKMKNSGNEGQIIADLETQLASLTTERNSLVREKNKFERDHTSTAKELADERAATKALRVNTGLTEALVTAKVATPLMDAAKALLRDKVEVKALNGEQVLAVGEKSLGDFVKEWSLGDQGKHFVVATSNGGTGANGNGGQQNQGGKTMTRAAYDEMVATNPGSIGSYFAEGGTISEAP